MITYEKYAEIRDSKGLTDGKIAEKAGFGRSTFTDWKSGRSIPKAEKMMKIADVLEMDYFEFVGQIGIYSSLNPNRPSAMKPTFDPDFATVSAADQNVLLQIIKNRDYRERLMEYAKLLKLEMDTNRKTDEEK